jgi:enoyl-[acyl-carrier protein] reductase I
MSALSGRDAGPLLNPITRGDAFSPLPATARKKGAAGQVAPPCCSFAMHYALDHLNSAKRNWRARRGAAARAGLYCALAAAGRMGITARGPVGQLSLRAREDDLTKEESMGFLAGKRILITGVLSNRSIAYGIARACHREGAELAFTFQGERFRERIQGFAAEFDSTLVYPCDVASDAEIAAVFDALGAHWTRLDGLVHAIGYAPREAISGDFLEGISREGFQIAHDISSYSFAALAKAALPMLGSGSSLLTLTYLGAERVLPNYNTLGLAKASLESCVRYMAESLGPKGIRVNGLSAGPIKTLAASGIKSFGKVLEFVAASAPLRRNVTIDDVGNVAAFLLSDLAAGVTAEITYVDAGFNALVGGMSAAAANAPTDS